MENRSLALKKAKSGMIKFPFPYLVIAVISPTSPH